MSAAARRRTLIPEVIQTSAMDCGVASVKALLGGLGIDVSYGRLREACQTDVDGTSIDVIETLTAALGLDAEQILLPVDHVLDAAAQALPAIAVVRLPNGFTHFVVLWRRHGAIVQLMDPARGRCWRGAATVTRELYVHSARLDAQAWRAWAESADFLDPLRRRMSALGVRDPQPLIDRALSDPGWARLAQLDAATRMTARLREARAIRGAREAARLLDTLVAEPPHPARDGAGGGCRGKHLGPTAQKGVRTSRAHRRRRVTARHPRR